MNQTRYPTAEERIIPPIYIPRRLHKLMERLARLEPGRYLLIVDVDDGDNEPCWTMTPQGKVENSK